MSNPKKENTMFAKLTRPVPIPYFLYVLMVVAAVLTVVNLILTGVADAATVNSEVSDAPLGLPFWTILAGSLVPAVGYVLNHHAPWVSEPVKAVVQVVVAAAAGALFQLITEGNVGFNNETASYVATTVVTALFAHKLFWAPSGISTKLGGGSNAPRTGVTV